MKRALTLCAYIAEQLLHASTRLERKRAEGKSKSVEEYGLIGYHELGMRMISKLGRNHAELTSSDLDEAEALGKKINSAYR